MTLEEYNLLWAERANHIFIQEELDAELKENPNLFQSYRLQELLAEKYNGSL